MKINQIYENNNLFPTDNELMKDSHTIKIYHEKKLLTLNKILFIILIVIFIITIISLVLYNQMLSNKLRKTESLLKVYKIFRADVDVKLFLKNKTKFYYKERKRYLKSRNKNYDESHLITFQDKLNYLMIHESPEYKGNIVDKIKLTDYSIKILGKDICIPILKTYNNVNEINIDELPDKFVLKCNHGSGMNIFCKNKSNFDLNIEKKRLNEWMNTNYGLPGTEFQYYFIERKILASPYLGKLTDYKTFCFNGRPKFIAARVILDEINHKYIYNYYDLNWTLTNLEYGRNSYKRDPKVNIKKPQNLDLIIEYSKKLSKEFVFVRIDFYEVNGTLYLGELTFSPSNVDMPYKDHDQRVYLGNLLNISDIKPSLFNN